MHLPSDCGDLVKHSIDSFTRSQPKGAEECGDRSCRSLDLEQVVRCGMNATIPYPLSGTEGEFGARAIVAVATVPGGMPSLSGGAAGSAVGFGRPSGAE